MMINVQEALVLPMLIAVSFSQSAEASRVSASINLSVAGKRLSIEKEGIPTPLYSKLISVSLSTPTPSHDVVRVLIDPKYKPNGPGAKDDDFVLLFKVKVKRSETLSSGALCKFNSNKSLAVCGIEDDGGKFHVVITRRSSTLKDSIIRLRILQGNGVYIARNHKEDDASILVRVAQNKAVDIPFKFN